MPLNDAYEQREDELYEMTPSELKKILTQDHDVKTVDADGHLDSAGRFYTDKEWLVRQIMRLEFPLGI